ncbi:hypothetical protein [Burkholderia cenocepacia]|uniref:hypothetical protein n=1 Tax=Burkholderia cenocepacia TaxID=95486 RepID=UPI0038488F88
MQANQTPTLVPLAFAAGGAFNTIPEASQIGTNPGGASLVDGFPPLTRTPIAAGGIPPSGLDMNGVLNLITQSTRWAHGGGRYAFNSAFAADTNVGGYPAGAMLMSTDGQGTWLSLVDNNSDNPDTGPGTKWAPSQAYGFSAISGLTNVNVTLTPAQAMKSRIVLTGALTGNVQIILPTWTREWTIVNNTTGAFTITVKTASGTGVAIPAGAARVVCDGTNVTQPAESIASATLPSHALTAGQIGAIGSQGNLPINTSAKVNGANNPNLLFNGSGEFGNAGWNGNALNVIIGSNGEGAILVNQSSISGAFAIYSNSVACTDSQPFTLSGLIATPGVSAGSLVLQIVFQNSSGGLISSIATPLVNASGAWTSYSVSGNAPTGAASMYAQISGGAGSTISSGGLFFRRMKLESGFGSSLYSQESSVAALGVGPNSAPVFVGQATQSGHAVQRSQSIGNGATVLSTPSRVVGTIYTNSTGRPLFIMVSVGSGNGNGSAGSGFGLSINGTVVASLFGPITNGISVSGTISAVVPVGATYVLNNTGLGIGFVGSWTEY